MESINKIPETTLKKKSKSWILAVFVAIISLAFCSLSVYLILIDPAIITWPKYFPMIVGSFGLFVSGNIASQERFRIAVNYTVATFKDIAFTIKDLMKKGEQSN